MARIAGVDIPNNKRVEIALTYIYGIGVKSSRDILAATGIDPDKRAKDLTEEETAKLREEIEKNYHVEGDLRIYKSQPVPQSKSSLPRITLQFG